MMTPICARALCQPNGQPTRSGSRLSQRLGSIDQPFDADPRQRFVCWNESVRLKKGMT